MRRVGGCPCVYTTPCDPRCTCVNSLSSTGCERCCAYGSDDQRQAKAEYLAALTAERDQLRKERDEAVALLRRFTEFIDADDDMRDSHMEWYGLEDDVREFLARVDKEGAR